MRPVLRVVLTYFGRRTLYVGGMAFMSFMLWIIGGLGFKKGDSTTFAIGSLLIALNFIYNVRQIAIPDLTPVHSWPVVLHDHRRDVVDPSASKVDRAVPYRLPDYEHHLRYHRTPYAVAYVVELGPEIRSLLGRRLRPHRHLSHHQTARDERPVLRRARLVVRAKGPCLAI